MEEADSAHVFAPEMVAGDFVRKYFDAFFNKRNVIHELYKDSSKLSRQSLDGEMSSASTVQGIKDILSSEYHSGKVEEFSIDAQQSCNDSVLVVVTGFLIGEGETKRSFTQTFVLAKEEDGYFVLNDIFRFGIGEIVDIAAANVVADEIDVANLLIEENQESVQVPNQQTEVKQSEFVTEKVISNGPTNPAPALEQVAVSKPASTPSKKQTQELPKLSYASMLTKKSPVSTPIKRPTPVVAVAPSANSYLDKKVDKKVPATPEEKTPVPQQAPAQRRSNAPSVPQKRTSNAPQAIDNSRDGKSIYVGNLPPHIPAEELDKAFSEFGPIRKDGIQVRTYEDGFCYGFVEFESMDAASEAIKVHTFWFGSYKSYVTEKKSHVHGSDKSNGNVRTASQNAEFHNNGSNRRENSTEGKRGGDFSPNRGPNNRSRNNSSFQNQKSNEFSGRSNGVVGEQKQGIKPAPPTKVN